MLRWQASKTRMNETLMATSAHGCRFDSDVTSDGGNGSESSDSVERCSECTNTDEDDAQCSFVANEGSSERARVVRESNRNRARDVPLCRNDGVQARNNPSPRLYGAATRALRPSNATTADDNERAHAREPRKAHPSLEEWRAEKLSEASLREAFFGVGHKCTHVVDGKACHVNLWGDADAGINNLRIQRALALLCMAVVHFGRLCALCAAYA